MILVIAIAGWLLLLIALCFILRDFTQFIFRKTFSREHRGDFIDIGEYTATWFGVLVIAIAGFVFYKVGTTLLAYVLSSDLISFFRMMRGVFTVGSSVQSPFTLQHFISGMLGQSILQFTTCYVIYWGIRSFMQSVNSKYGKPAYHEGDVLYFGFFAILLFMALEILSYSQHMPRVSGIVHLIYLSVAKLGLVCYFVAISHLHLLHSKHYRESLPQYIHLSSLAKTIVSQPLLVIIFTLGIGMALNIPLYLGTQFLENNWLVIGFALLSCYLFYKVIRGFIAKGYNYFGAIMFFDAESPLAQTMQGFKLPLSQRRNFLSVLVVLTLLLLVLKPKSFLFLAFFVLIIAVVSGLLHVLSYGLGLGISLILNLVRQQGLPPIRKNTMVVYLQTTAWGLAEAIAPTAVLALGAFVLLSIFPKKYDYADDESYVNTVIDAEHYPLFIGSHEGNICTPAGASVLPDFLIKCLLIQEDRDFERQRSWLPKWSNWHGISIASLYRMTTGTGGGSNLNMQLIKNEAFPGSFPRDFQRKYTEMLSAYQLSLQLSPKEIVTQYFNKVGMIGGNGQQGVVMAGFTAFKRPLQELNQLEMMYLVASLKRSTTFKTKKDLVDYDQAAGYAIEIKETLIAQARAWKKKGLVAPQELKLLMEQELRFSDRPLTANIATTTKEFLKKQSPEKESLGHTFVTTLNHENQKRMAKAVRRFNQYFRSSQTKQGHDLYSAALVIEVSTGKILGHHGGQGVTDLTTFAGGSPMGSVVKPFILLELLESDIASEDLRLYDGKIKGKFTPNNYSRRYSNRMISINEIISKSLNAPMINVREVTEAVPLYQQLERTFATLGIDEDAFLQLDDPDKSSEHEINYPMGSRNMTLFDIAQAYQTLFNNGRYRELRVFESAYDPYTKKEYEVRHRQKQVYESKNTRTMKEALHHTMLKGGTGTHIVHLLPRTEKFYAKTGTSDKAIHGYTILCDGQLLIVSYVTYGKVTGDHLELNDTPPIPFGSGARSAGVLGAYIYREWEYHKEDKLHIAFK
ncbi:penicillin-binding transpeptidase domain-containing protein [Fulvivirgaceae bacterium BMA10]|uniref:Penicillin-binding transpeptidase domain-containing protein n=1 Tax=Splendidivirga corallicola TaxID=3051826 RepID=A0ABT8KWQ3_9BACT|nr:penicillin-binding transpeptidase domain-containing protein [Fulvivirgaceae bacterium BMA10]